MIIAFFVAMIFMAPSTCFSQYGVGYDSQFGEFVLIVSYGKYAFEYQTKVSPTQDPGAIAVICGEKSLPRYEALRLPLEDAEGPLHLPLAPNGFGLFLDLCEVDGRTFIVSEHMIQRYDEGGENGLQFVYDLFSSGRKLGGKLIGGIAFQEQREDNGSFQGLVCYQEGQWILAPYYGPKVYGVASATSGRAGEIQLIFGGRNPHRLVFYLGRFTNGN
jgi:hypothetical protein